MYNCSGDSTVYEFANHGLPIGTSMTLDPTVNGITYEVTATIESKDRWTWKTPACPTDCSQYFVLAGTVWKTPDACAACVQSSISIVAGSSGSSSGSSSSSSSSNGGGGDDSCQHANDGTCDEGVSALFGGYRCASGTDTTDCSGSSSGSTSSTKTTGSCSSDTECRFSLSYLQIMKNLQLLTMVSFLYVRTIFI